MYNGNHLIYFSPLLLAIKYWDKGEVLELPLKEVVSVNFSSERSCIGYNDGKKIHPCPSAYVGKKQCSLCAQRDIARVYTRLDYSGFEAFYENFRNQEFSIYLASFAHIVKCGVTRSARLMERVREQGADYFCEIAKTNDADSAYSLESAVHQHFPIRSGLTSSQKLKLMYVESNSNRLSACVQAILESGLLSGFEGSMKVHKLNYQIPKSFSEAKNIDGRIISAKGQILFFEKDGSNYAINMSKKVGSFFQLSTL